MTTKQVDVEALTARYLHLEQVRASAVEEQDVIKAQLRDSLTLGKHETNAGTVTLSANRRFDPVLAAEVLAGISPDLVAACSVTKVDSALTKRKVGQDLYETCMRDVGAPRVAIA